MPLKICQSSVSPDIQKLLKPASNLLDDVEGFFLAAEVLRHPPRNEQQMAEWLGHAGNLCGERLSTASK